MTSRKKWTSNFKMGTMGKSLRRKGKTLSAGMDDGILLKGDEDQILGRMRVILTHLQENAAAEDILFISSGNSAPDAKEAVNTIVEAIVLDDTMGLIKALQTYSCATLATVVRLTFMSMKEPLLPCKMVGYMLDICEKYAPLLESNTCEKIEEIGSTLERYSNQEGTLDILSTLCQCLKVIPFPNDAQAYTFAPLILLPKLWMLNDPATSHQDMDLYFKLLASTDEVIEIMEFLIEHSDILFDSRARRTALLKDKFTAGISLRKVERIEEEGVSESFPPKADESGQHEGGAVGSEQCNAAGGFGASDAQAILGEEDVGVGLTPSSCSGTEDEDEIEEECLASSIETYQEREPVCTATALFDYEPVEDGEIALGRGDIIQVLEIEEDGWWYGRHPNGQVGIFPGVYVEKNEGILSEDEALSGKEARCEQLVKRVRAEFEKRFGPVGIEDDCDAVQDLMNKFFGQFTLAV